MAKNPDRDSSFSVKSVFITLLVMAVVLPLLFILIGAATKSASTPAVKSTTATSTPK